MAKGKVLSIRHDLPDTWEEALKDFLFWKQAQGMSERTLTDYRKHVSQLFNRHQEAYNPKKLKTAVLEYMSQPVKPATFNLRLVYLKSFFDWCIKPVATTYPNVNSGISVNIYIYKLDYELIEFKNGGQITKVLCGRHSAVDIRKIIRKIILRRWLK